MLFSKKAVALLSVVLASAIAFVGCASQNVGNEIVEPIAGETAVSYKTATVDYLSFEKEEKIPGTLGFSTTKEYYAVADGIVKSVLVEKNQTVKKGDLILTLDTADLDFKINDLEIKAAAAGDSSTREKYQIELDKLMIQKDAAVIKAPFDGIVNKISYMKEGTTVKKNTLLCAVSVPESIYVYNEQGVGKNTRFNMDVKVKINNIDFEGKMIAAPDTAPDDASTAVKNYCAAKLTESETRRLLDENDGIAAVDAGWATIYAVTVKRFNVLAVPDSAIKTDGKNTYCSVLQNKEKYDLPVEIGESGGGFTEIKSGLNKGDIVVLAESDSGNKK